MADNLSDLRAALSRYMPADREDREWPGRIVLEHDDGGRVLLELPLPADAAAAIIQAAGEHELELAGNDCQQVAAQAKRIAFLEDKLERREADAADLKCALEEERERNADVTGPEEGEDEADGPDEDPSADRDSYSVTIHPHPRHWHNPAGPWLIRCYTVTGEHVHSAEGGITLDVGLDEVKRAIHDREASR